MIIDKPGRKIDFDSTPGLGTTFYFDLLSHAQTAQQNEHDRGAMRM